MTTFLIVLAVSAALILTVSYAVFCMAFRPTKTKEDEWDRIPDNEQSRAFKERTLELCRKFASRPYESVSVKSFDGCTLYGKYYEVKKGAPLEIEFHGWHGSPVRDFCGGSMIAFDSGHNVLAIEERGMMRSGGKAITFGVKERQDCLSWCNWAAGRFGEDCDILIAGISMGAATVLMASDLPLPESVKGIIADCPYSSPLGIIEKVGKRDMHVPVWIIGPVAKLAARLWGGFSLTESSAMESIKKTDIPILLIHGDDDRFVPWEMSRDMAEAVPSIRFETFPGAGHGLSFMVDEERYRKVCEEFIESVLGEDRA